MRSVKWIRPVTWPLYKPLNRSGSAGSLPWPLDLGLIHLDQSNGPWTPWGSRIRSSLGLGFGLSFLRVSLFFFAILATVSCYLHTFMLKKFVKNSKYFFMCFWLVSWSSCDVIMCWIWIKNMCSIFFSIVYYIC